MEKKIGIALIGLGNRGISMLHDCLLPRREVKIVSVCDVYEDRRDRAVQKIKEAGRPAPFSTADCREAIDRPDVDAALLMTPWDDHINLACFAMRAGKYTGMEVGGAYSLDDCWKLVRTFEETGTPCMLLENCCYGKTSS